METFKQSWFIPYDFSGHCYIIDSFDNGQNNGSHCWIKKGKRLHRLDGPARIFDFGLEEWYIDDVKHRLDGPAVISRTTENPFETYFLNGQMMMTKEEWLEHPLVVEYKLNQILKLT